MERDDELEVAFRFDSHGNADPFRPYRVRAYFECPELGLQRELEFVVTFIDPDGRLR